MAVDLLGLSSIVSGRVSKEIEKKRWDSCKNSTFLIKYDICKKCGCFMKAKVKFKLLTGKDEADINAELASLKKIGKQAEVTTRLKRLIVSVNGEDDKKIINTFAENMLSKESLLLRDEVARINPDIDLKQEIEIGGDTTELDIPMTVEFFWPKSER